MKKGQFLNLTEESIDYLKFKGYMVDENMSAIVEDLIQRDKYRNQHLYDKMKRFTEGDDNEVQMNEE